MPIATSLLYRKSGLKNSGREENSVPKLKTTIILIANFSSSLQPEKRPALTY